MFGETATRIRPTVTDDEDAHGNPVPGTPDETDIDGWAFDPGGSKEPVEVGRAAVITTPKAYRRDTADVTSGDWLVFRGVTYEVDGDPAVWVSPWTQGTEGTVVELKRVEG